MTLPSFSNAPYDVRLVEVTNFTVHMEFYRFNMRIYNMSDLSCADWEHFAPLQKSAAEWARNNLRFLSETGNYLIPSRVWTVNETNKNTIMMATPWNRQTDHIRTVGSLHRTRDKKPQEVRIKEIRLGSPEELRTWLNAAKQFESYAEEVWEK